MGIGVSLLLIAVGAILIWAVNAEVAGIDIDAVGVILLIVGALGVVLSMMFWSSWGGFGGRRETVVREVNQSGARTRARAGSGCRSSRSRRSRA
jgi:hypothetical protein